jgi:hypothetical protein
MCTLRQVQPEQVTKDDNWEKVNAFRILVGKSEGKRLLERAGRRWVCSIKMDFREIGWSGLD